jgi:hypothetical protein
MRLPGVALVALTGLAMLAAAPPATADCQMAGPIEAELRLAPVAFVGRVTSTEGAAAWFAVSEVWAGTVNETVEVRGISDIGGGRAEPAAGEPFPIGEDDRPWTVGATYLVIPTVEGDVLRDSICSATAEWVPELAALRPADARIIGADGQPDGGGPPLPLMLVLGAVAVIGALSVLAFRADRSAA